MPGSIAYGNGVETTFRYDAVSHLTSLVTRNGATALQDLSYDWYSRSNTGGINLGSITDNRSNKVATDGAITDETQIFTYDPLYRLTRALGAWGMRTPNTYIEKVFEYDSIGRPKKFGGVIDRTLEYEALLLHSASGFPYENFSFNWTAEERLASVSKRDGTSSVGVAMTYNAEGDRVKKVSSSTGGPTVTTTYIGKMYEKRTYSDGSPNRNTLHVFANGKILASVTTSGNITTASNYPRLYQRQDYLIAGDTTKGPAIGTYFYHGNHISSNSVITDANGNEVTRLVYLPFGELSRPNSSGTDTVTSKFTGQEFDEETGLYYYGARYYDPMIGRFLSPDTTIPDPGNPQSFNRYSYALNNPIRYTDPTGQFNVPSFFAGLGLAVAGAAACFVPGGQPLGAFLIAGGVATMGIAASSPAGTGVYVMAGGSFGGSSGGGGLGSAGGHVGGGPGFTGYVDVVSVEGGSTVGMPMAVGGSSVVGGIAGPTSASAGSPGWAAYEHGYCVGCSCRESWFWR
jgi:RHS repeat-associated protein